MIRPTQEQLDRIHQPWPDHGLERVNQCPVCGSDDREVMHEGLRDRVFYCAPGEWTLYRCRECGSGYLDPRPTQETVGLAYAEYFTHTIQTGNDSDDLNWFQRLRRVLANGYRNHRYGTKLRPAIRMGVVAAMLLPTQRQIIDAEFRHLPRSQPGSKLLDVGCGNGAFLCLARAAGWNVVGVDFDPKAVQVARGLGLDVRQGGIDILDPEKESFDGITLSHVIEHVHSPLQLLHRCYALLKPGGWIWLETPNFEAQGYRDYGRNWRALDPPRHLVLFTRNALFGALEEAGFHDIEDMPYRPLCMEEFAASESIADGGCGWGMVTPSKDVRRAVKAAERKARKEPAVREFITLRARK